MEDETPKRPWNRQLTIYWTVVFLLNMPLPWSLGIPIAGRPWGPWGMAGGCLCVYAIGFYFAGRGNGVVRRVVWGGWFVAVTQCVVILHMIVGSIAEEIWKEIATTVKIADAEWTFLKGYTLTLIVGQMLILIALVIGTFLHFATNTVRGELKAG